MSAPVLGIAGWSGSGKTTLLEYVLPRLSSQGLRINVIKHTHHEPSSEDRSKDSFRLYAAGAAKVLVASSSRGREPDLDKLLQCQSATDLILVEGFKNAPIPKLEIYRPGLGEPALYPHDGHVIAVATDSPPPRIVRQRLIWLDLQKPAQVLSWIQLYIGTQMCEIQMRPVQQAVIL